MCATTREPLVREGEKKAWLLTRRIVVERGRGCFEARERTKAGTAGRSFLGLRGSRSRIGGAFQTLNGAVWRTGQIRDVLYHQNCVTRYKIYLSIARPGAQPHWKKPARALKTAGTLTTASFCRSNRYHQSLPQAEQAHHSLTFALVLRHILFIPKTETLPC